MQSISTDKPGVLTFSRGGMSFDFCLAQFPLGGRYVSPGAPLSADGDTIRYALGSATLIVEVKPYEDVPFWRLRYRLEGDLSFTSVDEETPIRYGRLEACADQFTEIQLSNFDRIRHTYMPLTERYQGACEMIGPIVLVSAKDAVALIAYEHGAEAPDHFLKFEADDEGVSLRSVKGNYFMGQRVSDYLSPWIEIGFARDEASLKRAYRDFINGGMGALAPSSREPYIFYNTWNNQERDKYFFHKPYLTAMHEGRMLEEIDAAHKMGIEVFVIDTGWYGKTGDWLVNLDRFSGGMKAVRDRLDGYGMKLGLWFNPVVAARTSASYTEHPEWVVESNGEKQYWGQIWETEESYGMCLVSGYADKFIEQLVEIHNRLGVSYYKWDAIHQYGCDSAKHNHGTEKNAPKERRDAYAYRMGLEMIRIAQEVTRRCPGVIVDFDITEGQRFVGLGFLAAGKYFLMNNGPYFSSFDIPKSVCMEPDTINVFFYPGQARAQVCRAFTEFDPLIPSTLFLTHFLPENEGTNMQNSMASLVLGGNGIWGDLPAMSDEDLKAWRGFLDLYKRVRHDAARAYPRTWGRAGSSPEVHEKLSEDTGRGLVCFFSVRGGTFTYKTRKLKKRPGEVEGADGFEVNPDGSVTVTVNIPEHGARVVFFM